MEAGLSHELIDMLDRFVFNNNEYGKTEDLQNLLILTAMKTKKEKVMGYITNLDSYNHVELAK